MSILAWAIRGVARAQRGAELANEGKFGNES